MLFYEKGRIYDTVKGTEVTATQSVIADLESQGVSIAGLHGEDWKSANMLKAKALTGLLIYHSDGMREEGDINDVLFINGGFVKNLDIVLSHYIHTVSNVHVCTPCNIVLDNTLVLTKFYADSNGAPFMIDINRLSDLKAYKFLWKAYRRKLSLSDFELPLIKLDDSRLKSLIFIILMHSKKLREFSNFFGVRHVFEPYYPNIVSILLSFISIRAFTIQVTSRRHKLYERLSAEDFATDSYLSVLLSGMPDYRDKARVFINDCIIMLKLFRYLPDSIKSFLAKIQSKLGEGYSNDILRG